MLVQSAISDTRNNINERFKYLNCCVIIPTYNNATTVREVIKKVLNYTDNVIVVNDGSTDNTPSLIQNTEKIVLVSYPRNKGKGNALKAGFNKALEMGFDYAITIDSDGQHNPGEMNIFLDSLEQNPGALIIGSRNFKDIEHLPSQSNFANNFSNFWFHFQTGVKLNDTQSGYRLYPLILFKKRKYYSRKYEFELEVIVRAAWQGMSLISIPIIVHYPPKEERVTHFRPFRDFLRISVLNFILTTLAIVYFQPRRIIRKYRKKKLKEIIREDILSGINSNRNIAISVGFGVFMGIFPVWGYQLAIGFLLAHIFKMNKAIFFLAANISIPPFIPFILYLSYVTGSFVLGEGSWKVDVELNLEALTTNLKQYIAGSIVLAFAAGLMIGLISFLLLVILKRKKVDV